MATDTADSDTHLDQTVELEDTGPGRKTLSITIPEQRIKDAIEKAYDGLQSDATLPGFRRGRAPRRLLEKKFAASLRDDVKQRLLSESYSQAVEEQELDVINEPELLEPDEDFELPESGDLTIKLDIEVTPEVKVPAFEDLTLEREQAEVTDSDVDAELEQARERAGSMKAVADAELGTGDYAQADVKILAGQDAADDAEVVLERADQWTLLHGEDKEFKGHIAGIVVQELGKKLAGKRVGDVERISMTGPSSHENDQIKDQPVTLQITIKEIHRLEPLALDALIERSGAADEAELRGRVREGLETRRSAEAETKLHQSLAEQLVAKSELELPEGLKSNQVERMLQQRRMELLYQGVDENEIDGQIAESREASESETIERLKRFFVLDALAKKLEIEVDQNEVYGRIARIAQQQQRRPDKVMREMQGRGEIEQIYLALREGKTLDAVIQQIEGPPAADAGDGSEQEPATAE